MNVQKIEQMYKIAERIVARSVIDRTVFSEYRVRLDDGPQDVVAALTEGWLRGRRVASWTPIPGPVYRDEAYRDVITERATHAWRGVAIGHLVPMSLLQGPKGKLPA